MRLLWVIDSLGRGGAETLLVHLAPQLQRAGFDISVAYLSKPSDLVPVFKKLGVNVWPLNIQGLRRADQALPRLTKVVARTQPDVLHAHLFHASIYSCLLPRVVYTGPRVTSLHSLEYSAYPPNTRLKRIRRRLHGYLLRNHMTKIVGVSQAVKQHYTEHLGLTEIDVIPNALPARFLANEVNASTTALGESSLQRPWVVTAGRFVKEKGHLDLIEAMALAKRAEFDVGLVIVGKGPLESQYHKAIHAHKLEDRVQILPTIEHVRLMELVRASDAFIMPSHHEGFGLAVVEAMALGVPCAVSDIPAFRELVDDRYGFVFPVGNSRKMMDVIKLAVSRSDTVLERAQAGQERALTQFDSSVVVDRWSRLYRDSTAETAGAGFKLL